jgi:2-keto-4-pentenoate hydratase/2-oxohepta-3-ene-1,7-dioic acid hydratase in catechol pathway
MRLVRFSIDHATRYGILNNDVINSLATDPFLTFSSNNNFEFDGKVYQRADAKLMAPCLPSKIVCLGLNYRPHAEEANQAPPSSPIIFLKPSTAVIGPDEPIVLPLNWKRVDYEGELGMVIGKKARFVNPEKAKDYVLGYTCVNDVTERQMQKDDGQWTRSKSFDTFAPVGPWVETAADPDSLKVETYLNGQLRQSDSTNNLIFGVSTVLAFVSTVMTLLPGDIISTGTPAGVGPVKPGDIVEIKVEKIGTLRNPVIAPKPQRLDKESRIE